MPYGRERARTPQDGPQQRGISDGLLVGLLGFLLGITALCWTATGLAGLLAHGAWPPGTTFTRTPLAMRALLSEPRDLAAAWPDTPAGALPGPGLFWGVLIGEFMVAAVLGVFVVNTVARRRALRAARRDARRTGARPGAEPAAPPHGTTVAPASEQHPAPYPGPRGAPSEAPLETAPHGTAAASPPMPPPVPARPLPEALPAPTTGVAYGRDHGSRAADALRAAPGPALVVTADPALWAETVGARAKLGPVHLYDPDQRTDAPVRLRWAPHQGCEDRRTAAARAAALLAPVRSPARVDAATHGAAETLLGCWLHAAAIAGEPFRQVHRWATSAAGSPTEAVHILRTHPRAASGAAGELEATLVAHPERRDAATHLVRDALSALSQLHVRNACTASRADSAALESFAAEGGTLYVVGEANEDPRRVPGTMPLLTALTASVVEHGRRMAAGSSAGRLDPPLTLILDNVAAVAPIPQLPDLLAAGESMGMPTLALLRSEAQARAWWPQLAGDGPVGRATLTP
ncbi:MAG TPA: type IV secretory system conjugative DNA transfer family protein [Streptomyces sp.]|uniref:type IV secretory system conjugative DNA transfer family protein n=1 Tax=Streptomyces sp. TaxID=1931 RepID=UPI002D72EFCD|nr:type IV secretory system conjugative DNA transfer family protein [Streptomyces sp.]HZG02208.1 type IV secretory system conjugative DNA transfer family protein [Streptomyces sp.]